MKYKRSDFCPNCHFPLPYKAKFCAHCGQKDSEGPMSFSKLLKQVWLKVLHLESRSLHFLWQLFVPGQVSREFLGGKQKRYPPPIQFFFVIMFIFLFTVKHTVGTDKLQFTPNKSGVAIQERKEKAITGPGFYERLRKYAEFQDMRRQFDSLPESYRTPMVQKAVDSLLQRTYGYAVDEIRDIWQEVQEADSTATPDSVPLNLGFQQVKIATLDFVRMEPEAIIRKYKIESWSDKMLVRQGIKSIKESDTLMSAYLGSLGWSILALIACMASVLTLLYWRQKRYYVEHFIFLLNEHSSLFLTLTLAFWLHLLIPLSGWLWGILICWLVLTPYLAMRRFYGQGRLVTFLKWSLFSLFYLIGFILLFVLALLVVFMLF